jgi:hypothetical protein
MTSDKILAKIINLAQEWANYEEESEDFYDQGGNADDVASAAWSNGCRACGKRILTLIKDCENM